MLYSGVCLIHTLEFQVFHTPLSVSARLTPTPPTAPSPAATLASRTSCAFACDSTSTRGRPAVVPAFFAHKRKRNASQLTYDLAHRERKGARLRGSSERFAPGKSERSPDFAANARNEGNELSKCKERCPRDGALLFNVVHIPVVHCAQHKSARNAPSDTGSA